MSSVWVLMHNVEIPCVHAGEESLATESKPIRVYQQRATAMSTMDRANTELGKRDKDGNHQYYSIEEVNYV